jgi:hypothetical protein
VLNRNAIIFGFGLLVAGVIALSLMVRASQQSRVGPKYIFQLSEKPAFLAEELALSKARETLMRDGLDSAAWHPVPDNRTRAPDGRIDAFMARNTVNSNRATFMFTNSSLSARFVSVTLEGNKLICQGSIGK